ncbi:N-acetylmuramoyl-L-alanine amidase [Clostridium sp. AM58-1XD]|nr:N-acetylmuramoyl-L-alanine amidase [Clostridium sp. AM58-1XD]
MAAMVLTLGIAALNGCGKNENADASAAVSSEGEAETEEVLQVHAESSSVEAEVIKETAPAMKDVEETVYVTGDTVNLRKDGYASAEVVETVAKGTQLKRIGYSDTWSRVIYKDQILCISTQFVSTTPPETEAPTEAAVQTSDGSSISLNPSWKYADFSKINSGAATLYKSQAADRKGITVCVNAGHGTTGGTKVKTLCHPDGTPKVTSGSTKAGATSAAAVSTGMEFADGTAEAKVTLAMAKTFKDKLLAAGYDVVMIRETDDVQLDNIARTVIANNTADCHIAIHWDSSTNDKGAFYMSVPDIASYKNMEPVKSHWQQHNALGESVIGGLRAAGIKIFSNGAMAMDLTQTSYSTVPSIDIELGDKVSDHSQAMLDKLAAGMVAGVNTYFGK